MLVRRMYENWEKGRRKEIIYLFIIMTTDEGHQQVLQAMGHS